MQVRKLIFIAAVILSAFGFNLSTANAVTSQAVRDRDGASEVKILASYYQDSNHKSKLITGFSFKIKDGWKIYGNDDSGLGQPPSFKLEGSKNIDSGKINVIWPEPIKEKEMIGQEIINYAIYKKEVIIPVELEVLNPTSEAVVMVNLSYALCKDVCIPVFQSLALKIPAGEIDPKALREIQKYLTGKTIIVDSANSEMPPVEAGIQKSKITLIYILWVAFIGGLILNIMPCVLPVLSIKIISIIKHADASLQRIRLAYLSTIGGILFSFLTFALLTSILKSLGNSFGWGLQFQNPYFLIFLVVVLTVFAASILDNFSFTVGTNVISYLNNRISKLEQNDDIVDVDGLRYDVGVFSHKARIIIPNFLSGILAVLLATPCSAPFLGTAISFALSQNAAHIFLIFTVMAFGLAFPYFLLIVFPSLVYKFPKPGNWMNVVKKILAGFLLGTIFWLIYILCDNSGQLICYVVTALAILIMAILHFNFNAKIKLVLLIITIISMFVIPQRIAQISYVKEKVQDQLWIKFDPEQINYLVRSGKVVVIDITADWCITCKLNKALVLTNDEVVARLKQSDIVAMRGDLTKPDEVILTFMRSHNRYGIPFNIVYGPHATNGILVSELLNKASLLEAIEKAK